MEYIPVTFEEKEITLAFDPLGEEAEKWNITELTPPLVSLYCGLQQARPKLYNYLLFPTDQKGNGR